ncbi:MAG: hypothetical protein PHI97_23725 [Desulfobulbus sp.]|nr:hypothetical protein [Desulfobulbus sp.]
MGKIKLNRSKKKRAAKETSQGKPSVEELRRTLGFPDGTAFLGYAIHLKESDEFLAELTDLPEEGIVKKVWTSTPQHAVCYNTLSNALKILEECPNAVVVGLFDTGNQIMTVTMSLNR